MSACACALARMPTPMIMHPCPPSCIPCTRLPSCLRICMHVPMPAALSTRKRVSTHVPTWHLAISSTTLTHHRMSVCSPAHPPALTHLNTRTCMFGSCTQTGYPYPRPGAQTRIQICHGSHKLDQYPDPAFPDHCLNGSSAMKHSV